MSKLRRVVSSASRNPGRCCDIGSRLPLQRFWLDLSGTSGSISEGASKVPSRLGVIVPMAAAIADDTVLVVASAPRMRPGDRPGADRAGRQPGRVGWRRRGGRVHRVRIDRSVDVAGLLGALLLFPESLIFPTSVDWADLRTAGTNCWPAGRTPSRSCPSVRSRPRRTSRSARRPRSRSSLARCAGRRSRPRRSGRFRVDPRGGGVARRPDHRRAPRLAR
jgi:hypothetical protein